jgi:esterase
MKLFFRETGAPDAPAMVILHGVFGSSDNWLSIGKVLGEDFRVIMADQRNHGQSPRSEAFGYTEMAQDLAELLEDLNLQNPILIGHSMGGKTVMQFAQDYPQAFSKLIVVDIAPKFYPIHHGAILQGLNAIPLETLASRQVADQLLAPYEDNPGVRQFLLKNLYRNSATGQFAWRLNLPVLTREIHGVGEELHLPRPIEQPALFMHGSESRYVLPEDHSAIERIFKQASFVEIQGAGHWVQADQPQAFVEAVRAFC